MNRKILYVFISIVFACLLSASLVCAADNSTSNVATNDDSSTSLSSQPSSTTDNTNTGTISDFKKDIDDSKGNMSLKRNYAYDNKTDLRYLENGIILKNTQLAIEGNNYTINMNGYGSLFNILNSTVKINNLNVKNTNEVGIRAVNSDLTTNHVSFENNASTISAGVIIIHSEYNSSYDSFTNLKNDDGSAIIAASGSKFVVTNATFNIPTLQQWGAIYIIQSEGAIINTTFANMTSKYATAIYNTNSTLSVINSTFMNLHAQETGGAIGVKDIPGIILIDNCKFINTTSIHNAGALFADINGASDIKNGRVVIYNSKFEECASDFGGAVLQLGGSLLIANSSFTKNDANILGGAVYTSNADLVVVNSTFDENAVPDEEAYYNQGGAIYFDLGELTIKNSRFNGNKALEGTDAYLYDANYSISNSYFTGNIVSMFDQEKGDLENNTFLGKNSLNESNYIYVYDSNGSMIPYDLITLDASLANSSYFNLVDYGLVTPVKNQGNMGSCWAFGVTGSLESAYLKATNKKTELDISETNIQDSGLMYNMFGIKETTEGSMRTVGTSYMLSWLGVTTSDDNTYDELGKISAIYDNGTKYHIHNVVLMEPRKNINDNQKFKEALVKYGAVGVSVHGASKEDDSYNEETYAGYFYNETFGIGTDHSVTLVGWNDSFSRNNFVTTPPGDGAWIIKNSWGSDWADKGYYYVSYYDTAFGTGKIPVAFIIDNNHTYEKNYQYDIISRLEYIDYEEDISYANKFESVGKDLISAVGTYFNDSEVEYEIKIYVNDILAYKQSGISKYPGYETIKLDKFVGLKEGDEFIIEMSAGSLIPMSKLSRQHYKANTSFIVSDNVFVDTSKDGNVVCLKAYTIPDNSYMNVEKNGNIIKVTYFDQNATPLANTEVKVRANGNEYTFTTDDDGVIIFNADLPAGRNIVTIINPVSGEEVNVTVTIPSTHKKTGNTHNIKNVKNVRDVKTLHKTYKVIVKDKVIFEGKYFTIQSLNEIFGQNFINGHLVVYIDGKVVFNGTVGDDLSTIIFKIIDSLLGKHELKVEITVNNETQTYTENITIS